MPTQPVESAHQLFEVAIRCGYESDIHLRLSQQLQVQEADHPQEIEKTEEEGRKLPVDLVKIGENCDFTSPRKRPS
jgi:hypothetical protein